MRAPNTGLHAAFPQDVEHVVHPLVRPGRRLPGQELDGVRGALGVHPPPAHVVPELKLDPAPRVRIDFV